MSNLETKIIESWPLNRRISWVMSESVDLKPLICNWVAVARSKLLNLSLISRSLPNWQSEASFSQKKLWTHPMPLGPGRSPKENLGLGRTLAKRSLGRIRYPWELDELIGIEMSLGSLVWLKRQRNGHRNPTTKLSKKMYFWCWIFKIDQYTTTAICSLLYFTLWRPKFKRIHLILYLVFEFFGRS